MASPISDLSAVTANDLSSLESDAQHCIRLDAWSADAAAAAIVALANADGGIIVTALADGDDAATLNAAAAAVEPEGARLVGARVLDTPNGRLGLIAVNECADPPALIASSGAVCVRDGGETKAVVSRAELGELLAKRDRLRSRATRALDAQVERIAFGHANYYTIAVVFQPLLNDKSAVEWARANQADLLSSTMARRWGLTAEHVDSEGSTVEIQQNINDDTGFITVGSNGAIAAGVRNKRPALERFLSASELTAWVNELAEVVRMVQAGGAGVVGVPALFFEGFRELRMEAGDGYGAPAKKDLDRVVLDPQYVKSDSDRDAVSGEALAALGDLFGADISAGTVAAFEGTVNGGPSQKTWHGKTLRTERRMTGERGFGSGR